MSSSVIAISQVHLQARGVTHDPCWARPIVLSDSTGGLLTGCRIDRSVHLR